MKRSKQVIKNLFSQFLNNKMQIKKYLKQIRQQQQKIKKKQEEEEARKGQIGVCSN